MKKTATLNIGKKIAMNHNESVLVLNVQKKIAMNHNESILRLTK
jgi:hypothetical protein